MSRPKACSCRDSVPPIARTSALYDAEIGLGYAGQIFLNGEEVSPSQEGRVFAHLMDGTSYELPWLGKASWENLLAHPDTGTQTVVVGLDDSSGTVAGQAYVYVGQKTVSTIPTKPPDSRMACCSGLGCPAWRTRPTRPTSRKPRSPCTRSAMRRR